MRFIDEELGEVVVRRSAVATSVRFSLAPDGRLRISAPAFVSDRRVKKLLENSRDEIGRLLISQKPKDTVKDGQKIGKSYTVVFRGGDDVEVAGKQIFIGAGGDEVVVTQEIRDAIVKALRVDAKEYLPKRLKVLAEAGGFKYETVRLSHASSRWGSCSSGGTVSLNITLMRLPNQLIDYVLIHELAHTRHMNHSAEFWAEVAKYDPNYRRHRKALKMFSPFI
ncbi:M48 family metallopeptidase [Candidatus Saccharibacteria bacterium]|nr:M48 family metallopeptidase [Candidatus Saccharibacteria bacterium]